jgi:hypothetical protein
MKRTYKIRMQPNVRLPHVYPNACYVEGGWLDYAEWLQVNPSHVYNQPNKPASYKSITIPWRGFQFMVFS